MEQTLFAGEMEGLKYDRIVRDYEYNMTTRHVHNEYEIYYLLEGERYYFIDKESFYIQGGTFALVGRNQIHKTSMAGRSYHDRILMEVRDYVCDDVLKAIGLPSMEDIFLRYYGVIQVEEERKPYVEALLFQIQEELSRRQTGYEMVVKLKLAELLAYLYRLRRRENTAFLEKDKQTPKHKKVSEVAEFIMDHYEEAQSLDSLAKRFYVSKCYLSRIFKEVTGFTINEYINFNRVKRAQQLLCSSEYSVTDIAGVLGYDSITYFERVFKKYSSVSPLQYRKKFAAVQTPGKIDMLRLQ